MSKKIRIYNITSFLRTPGFGLEFEGKYIAPNPTRPLITEVAVIPEILERWQASKWVKITDAEDKTPVTKESEAVVTPGLLSEAKASELPLDDDILADDIVDFSLAKEATLPTDVPENTGPVPLQSISQIPSEEAKPRAKVSLGTESRMNLADTVSPIPGDRPTSIDNSDAFTVRAPRQSGPGAVIKGS